jgi:hypothetical protein
MQSDFPDIPLSHFYAALAYYYANKAAVDAYIAADEAEAKASSEKHLAMQRLAG